MINRSTESDRDKPFRHTMPPDIDIVLVVTPNNDNMG